MDEKTDYEKRLESIYRLAELLGNYRKALLQNGFSDENAMILVKAYQDAIIGLSIINRPDNGDEP